MSSNICQACGRPGTKQDPIVKVEIKEKADWDGTYRIHRSHADRFR